MQVIVSLLQEGPSMPSVKINVTSLDSTGIENFGKILGSRLKDLDLLDLLAHYFEVLVDTKKSWPMLFYQHYCASLCPSMMTVKIKVTEEDEVTNHNI